jgi:hypothetical protein
MDVVRQLLEPSGELAGIGLVIAQGPLPVAARVPPGSSTYTSAPIAAAASAAGIVLRKSTFGPSGNQVLNCPSGG